MKRISLVMTVVAALLGTTLYYFLHRTSEAGNDNKVQTQVQNDKPQMRSLCRWGASPKELVFYQLNWTSEQSNLLNMTKGAQNAPTQMKAKTQIAGRLAMQRAPGSGCKTWVWFDHIDKATAELMGQNILTEPTDLTAAKVLARWDNSGALMDLGFDKKTPRLMQNLFNSLLSELQVRLPDPGELKNNRGQVTTSAVFKDGIWQRRKNSYRALTGIDKADTKQKLDAVAQISLNKDGLLQHFAEHEKLEVNNAQGQSLLFFNQQIELQRSQTQAAQTQFARQLDIRRQPGEPALDDDNKTQILKDRAKNLSAIQLLANVRTLKDEQQDNGLLMWAGTARLTLEPELCAQVAKVISANTSSQAQRELGLDLLAYTGTAEAQKAMRQALGNANLLDNPRAYVALLQRFSFVKNPKAESITFVRQQAASEGKVDPDVQRAATFTLGAMANKMRSSGHAEEAKTLVALLTASLKEGDDESNQRANLEALGNAQDPNSEALLLKYSQSDLAKVRSTAAHALRHFTKPVVTRRLLNMGSDKSSLVQRAALGSLQGRKLDKAALNTIHKQLSQGRNAKNTHTMLVNLLAPYHKQAPAQQALQLILQQNRDDSKLRARIRALLKNGFTN